MARVFVTQLPHRRDRETNALVPSVNIGPAQEHGEVVVMMPPQAAFYATQDLVAQISNHLDSYSYEDGDSIIALGDPTVMATAFAYLGAKFGKFHVLKWDRQLARYLRATVKV